MNREEAIEFVRQSLARNRPPGEIIAVLQREMGMDETRAKRAIAYVRKNHQNAAPTTTNPLSPPAAAPIPSREAHDELVQYVISKMGRGLNINDIILHVVENSKMDWPQAQRFVARISREHKDRIEAKQAPVMLPLSVGAVIAGIAMMVFSVVLVGIILSGQYEIRRGRDLGGFVVVPVVFLTGLGLMVGGARAVNSQLRVTGISSGFYSQVQAAINFMYRIRWIAAGSGVIVFGVIFFFANIYTPPIYPTGLELAEQVITAMNSGDRNFIFNSYGETDVCGIGRQNYNPTQEFDSVVAELGGETLIIQRMWVVDTEYDNRYQENVVIDVTDTASGIAAVIIETDSCVTGRCVCSIRLGR